MSEADDFTTDDLKVVATERIAGTQVDTGALGVSDERRELILYDGDMNIVARRQFIGCRTLADGTRVPRFAAQKREAPRP